MREKKSFINAVLSLLMLSGLAACASSGGRTMNSPDYEQAYQTNLTLGAQYVNIGRYDLAEPKLIRAIEIDSQRPDAWNVLAVLYEATQDISKGYQVYQKLIHSHPDYLLGYTNFATFLCTFNRHNERRDLYQSMRAKNNEFKVLSYIYEGNCEREKGNVLAAEAAYREALVYEPTSAGALLPLADMALSKGEAQLALQYLRVMHTYVGHSAESTALGIRAARAAGDARMEEDLTRMMRAKYKQTSQAQALGI